VTVPGAGRSRPSPPGVGVVGAGARRRAVLVAMSPVLVLGTLAAAIGAVAGQALLGLLVGLALAGAYVALAFNRFEAGMVSVTGARPADAHRHARLLNLADGLCVGAGVAPPRLFVIEDPARNALSAGLGPDRTILAVTSGLLADLSRVELEGVVARQLAFIRSRDVVLASVAVALVGRPLSWLGRPVPRRAGAAADRLVGLAVGTGADERADLAGVGLTRYPPGLCSALEKVSSSPGVRSAPDWSRVLWMADPSPSHQAAEGLPSDTSPIRFHAPSSLRAPADLHSPIEQRVQALKEL